MRTAHFGVLFCVLVFASPGSAQVPVLSPPSPITTAVRDQQAVTAVQNAISALGGASLIGLQQSWVAQGSVTGNSAASALSGTFTWEAAGSEYRFAGSSSSGQSLFVTGHGNPTQVSAGKSQAVSPYMAQAMFVPTLVGPVLLQELQNQAYSIRYSGTDTIGSESVVKVTTAAETKYPDNVITPQTWYFDVTTGLPIRVDFRSPAPKNPASYVGERFDYSNFRAIAGVVFPLQVDVTIAGQLQRTFVVNTVSVNASIASSDFDPPGGGVQ